MRRDTQHESGVLCGAACCLFLCSGGGFAWSGGTCKARETIQQGPCGSVYASVLVIGSIRLLCFSTNLISISPGCKWFLKNPLLQLMKDQEYVMIQTRIGTLC